ncbi:MAG: hypothetical protein BPH43C_38 [Phage 5P_1]|nr:MAG: hypothetical protein BPH43C_38 [Phage 5P_1]
MRSAFDMEIDTTSLSGLTAGQRYVFEVVDAVLREKVVVWNDLIPHEARGKEYDTLSDSLKKRIEEIELTYPSGDPAPRYVDRVTISVQETSTKRKIRYALDFPFKEGGRPTKEFYAFCEAVGRPLRDPGKFKFGDIIPLGFKFSAIVIKDKNGFDAIDRDSVGPADLANDANAPEPKVYEPLTNAEAALFEALKKHKARLHGNSSGEILTFINEGIATGELKGTFGELMSTWKSLTQKCNLIQDGKIVLE